MLQFKVESLDAVNPAFHEHYVQQDDGTFALNVEGMQTPQQPAAVKGELDPETKKKMIEFRDRNIALNKEIEDLKQKVSKYQGLDPEKARDALERVDKLSEQQLLDEGKIEELIAGRTESMRQRYEGQIQSLTEKQSQLGNDLNNYKNRYHETIIDHSIGNAIQEIGGVNKGASPDIRHRARQVWALGENEQPVAKRPDGSIIYGDDGATPLSMTEWLGQLRNEAPHLFQQAVGGGATGSKPGANKVLPGTVDWNNPHAVSHNLEDIAKGKVEVVNS